MPRGKTPTIQPGDTFGLLTVLRFDSQSAAGKRRYLCACACGETKAILGASLTAGRAQSCGCLRRQVTGDRRRTHGHTDGRSWTSAYSTWKGMKQRCYDLNHMHYHLYGGRGITVCDEWRESFEAFLADMGEPPAGRSLDRIDVDGPYCKSNCRWATPKEQAANKRPKEVAEHG